MVRRFAHSCFGRISRIPELTDTGFAKPEHTREGGDAKGHSTDLLLVRFHTHLSLVLRELFQIGTLYMSLSLGDPTSDLLSEMSEP